MYPKLCIQNIVVLIRERAARACGEFEPRRAGNQCPNEGQSALLVRFRSLSGLSLSRLHTSNPIPSCSNCPLPSVPESGNSYIITRLAQHSLVEENVARRPKFTFIAYTTLTISNLGGAMIWSCSRLARSLGCLFLRVSFLDERDIGLSRW